MFLHVAFILLHVKEAIPTQAESHNRERVSNCGPPLDCRSLTIVRGTRCKTVEVKSFFHNQVFLLKWFWTSKYSLEDWTCVFLFGSCRLELFMSFFELNFIHILGAIYR